MSAKLLAGVLVASGCTTILGVDGQYSADTATLPSATLSSAGGAGDGGGATGDAGGGAATSAGGGGNAGFTELPACTSLVAIQSLRGRVDEVGQPLCSIDLGDGGGGLRVRARVVSGRVSVAADEPGSAQRSVVFREASGEQLGLHELSVGLRGVVPFDSAPWLGAGRGPEGELSVFGLDDFDYASSTTRYLRLIDAWPSGLGAGFLVEDESGWKVLTSDSLDDGFSTTAMPLSCETSSIVTAAMVEHTAGDPVVVAACADGTAAAIGGDFVIDHPVGSVRSVAATRAGPVTYVVTRSDDGVFVASAPGGSLTQVDQVAPYDDAALGDERRDRVTIAVEPSGDAIVGWTRPVEGRDHLKFARCGVDGSCCSLDVESRLEEAFALSKVCTDLTEARDRYHPALASSPDGENLALSYLVLDEAEIKDVVGLRLEVGDD